MLPVSEFYFFLSLSAGVYIFFLLFALAEDFQYNGEEEQAARALNLHEPFVRQMDWAVITTEQHKPRGFLCVNVSLESTRLFLLSFGLSQKV